jgi:hypothetical protein
VERLAELILDLAERDAGLSGRLTGSCGDGRVRKPGGTRQPLPHSAAAGAMGRLLRRVRRGRAWTQGVLDVLDQWRT